MDFCDVVCQADESGRAEAVRALAKRLTHRSPEVLLQTAAVINTVAQNGKRPVHLALCNRELLGEIRKIVLNIGSNPRVVERLKQLLLDLQVLFKGDSAFSMVSQTIASIKENGVAFEGEPAPRAQPRQESTSSSASGSASSSSSRSKSSRTAAAEQGPSRKAVKVKAMYDFEATEENELPLRAGEVVLVVDNSDPNWWCGRKASGQEGYFPAAFVTTEADRPKPPQEINELQLDTLLKVLGSLTPEQPPPPTLAELLAAHEAMKPLVKARLDACGKRKKELEESTTRFAAAMARYDALMQAPPPPPPVAYAPGYAASPVGPGGYASYPPQQAYASPMHMHHDPRAVAPPAPAPQYGYGAPPPAPAQAPGQWGAPAYPPQPMPHY